MKDKKLKIDINYYLNKDDTSMQNSAINMASNMISAGISPATTVKILNESINTFKKQNIEKTFGEIGLN